MAKQNDAQIALRTKKALKALIREAADYLGQDMSGFIIGAAVQAARRVLGREPTRPIFVSPKDKH